MNESKDTKVCKHCQSEIPKKAKVMEMSKDDTITLKVHIKSVGEVIGYSADIIEIE